MVRSILDWSVVVCTRDRPDYLRVCLESISSQSLLPAEIIVINDHGNRERLETALTDVSSLLSSNGTGVKILDNPNPPGLTQARNFAIPFCRGDVITYLDDDVSLDADYFRALRASFEAPSVMGAQGYLGDARISTFYLAFRRVFRMHASDPKRCSVLPSGHNSYPLAARTESPCDWLSGTNQSYRRSILMAQKFDANLKAPPSGEDLDFSFRLECRAPGSLRLVPAAKLVHLRQSRADPSRKGWFMREAVYRAYLTLKFRKIARHRISLIWFAWSRSGFLLEQTLAFVGGQGSFSRKERAKIIVNYVEANSFAARNIRKIASGDLEFLNSKY